MIDYPDRLQTENDNWLCQSDRLPDYDLQWTRDYTTTILETVTLDFTMLKLCHGIGPIWYKEEEVTLVVSLTALKPLAPRFCVLFCKQTHEILGSNIFYQAS